MKKILLTITTLLLWKISNAQMFKSFHCSITKADSCISVYSLKVKFYATTNKESYLDLVKAQLSRDYNVEPNNIISIEGFRGKQFRTFLYKIKIENVRGCNERKEEKK